MNKRWGRYLVILGIAALVAGAGFYVVKDREQKMTGHSQPDHEKDISKADTTEEKKSGEYLSITYTTEDFTVESGRMMTFYTYDPVTSELDNKAEIPFESQYALGVVSLRDEKIYYTKTVGYEGRTVDHLFEYDMTNGMSTMLEDDHCAYNDMIPVQDKLLLTTIPVHAIGTAAFDLGMKKFNYLYEMSLNENGYMDFPYVTEPLVRLNYNYKYGKFVNVYTKEEDYYDPEVRGGEKPIKYRIALVDKDLNIIAEYKNLKKSFVDYNVRAACQISSDCALVMIEKDLSDDEDSDVEVKYEFYMINFSEKSCKKVKSPFPRMKYITNFVTSDDGKSYYISGICMDGTSGLYYYDCSKDDVKMIMPNSVKGGHVVSFCLIDLDH